MRGPCGYSEDQTAEKDSGNQIFFIRLGWQHDFLGSWNRGYPCYILLKDFSTFCFSPETLHGDEFKSD